MNGLKSYRLKTVVMLMVKQNPHKDWKVDPSVFLEVLGALGSHLERGTIPYYFDENQNLIHGMPNTRKAEIAYFIDEAVRDLRQSLGTKFCYDTWSKVYFEKSCTKLSMPSESFEETRVVPTAVANDSKCTARFCKFVLIVKLLFFFTWIVEHGSKWVKIK